MDRALGKRWQSGIGAHIGGAAEATALGRATSGSGISVVMTWLDIGLEFVMLQARLAQLQ